MHTPNGPIHISTQPFALALGMTFTPFSFLSSEMDIEVDVDVEISCIVFAVLTLVASGELLIEDDVVKKYILLELLVLVSALSRVVASFGIEGSG